MLFLGVKVRRHALLLIPLLDGFNVDMMVKVSQPSWTLDWKFCVEYGGQREKESLVIIELFPLHIECLGWLTPDFIYVKET